MRECESGAIKLVKQLLQAQLVERNSHAAVACLTEDVLWLGTTEGKDVHNRQQAAAYFDSETQANPNAYALHIVSAQENRIGPMSGVAIVKARANRDFVSILILVTATTKPENDAEKICALHISMVDTTKGADARSPFSLTKEFADNTYREFIEKSISTGIVGGYFEPGFPFFTVNQHFLNMMGYASEEEYVADINGMVENSIHPDDRILVSDEITEQLRTKGQYNVQYRMRKKDGEYIYIEDQGKTVAAADGRTVMICLCNDITENIHNIEHLKRLADQLSLYRISQNAGAYRILVDDQFTLLYGNDRLYQMLEYTEESLREKLHNSCLAYVHPDDRAMIREKVEAALSGNNDNRYTQWVMRVITGKGNLRYLHVTGAFTKTELGYVMEGVDIDVTEQKSVERQLYERNAVFDVLLDNSNLSMWTYDIQTHVATLLSSKRHERPLSFQGTQNYPESIIATGIINPASIETMRDLLKKVDEGVPMVSADIWYQPKNAEAWCDKVTYVSILDHEGKIIQTVGIGEDVTEQRVAQQQYEEELQYQQTLQNENLLTKVRCNITKNIIEVYDVLENVRVCEVASPFDEAIEALAETGYTEEDRKLVRSMLRADRIIEDFEHGQHAFSLEFRRRTRDGQVIWVNISSRTYRDRQSGDIKSFMYTINIDREKVNENMIRAVAAAEHDFVTLVNLNTDEYYLYHGSEDGDLMPPERGNHFTQIAEQVNRSSVLEADLERALHDSSPAAIRENLKSSRLFSAAYAVKLDNGTAGYKKMQYFWLDEEAGLLILTRSDITDITREQQRQQELLKSALRQAEQANHAKTDFLSKMSHEIRTPMNAIIGMNALAAQSINDPQTAGECISKVGISARYLLTLINDILDMSRIESGKMNLRREKIPFEEFINGINTIIYEQATRSGLSYDAIINGYLEEAYIGDAMKLQQVLVNLLGNAVKFTPAGGKVQLIISQERTDKNTAYMRFTVNDTGVGISEEFQKVMFDPFEQEYSGINTPYGGTGLGLAITKNLVDLMGGSITLNSIVGVGSEFVVNIPLGIDPEKSNANYRCSMPLDQMRALIVDDEVLICQQAENLLQEIGMKAEWVTSGQKAVELVNAKWQVKKYYDIILVDWKMPEMDGIETARRIRKIVGPDVTIIIITAYEWAEIEKEAKAAGVNLLLTKPLFKSSLISTFERMFAEKSRTTEAPQPVDYDFSGKHVLLVEDHLLNIEVAKRLLAAKGMAVEVAENGLGAIEMFAANPAGYFDAILMDIRMPVMDGLTATRSIRQMKKSTAKTIPIIAMSANAFDEDIEKSKAAGMNAHLSKPIEPQELYATLQRFIGKVEK